MNRIIKDVEHFYLGKKVLCNVHQYSRGGSLSPTLEIIEYNGIRFVPYNKHKPEITITGLFVLLYKPGISNLIGKDNNWLWYSCKKDDKFFQGNYYHIPVEIK